MNIRIADIMTKRVVVAQPHHTIGHVRQLMERNRIGALPVVGPDNEALGIVTSTDLLRRHKDESPCSRIMSDGVRAVPAYNEVSVAARIMRKHKIHHVVVTKERKVVGMISSFDLLKLVDGNRFQLRQAPTPAKNRKRRG
ncbi:MAG: CBS domain-containing protein [Alphaproteobacteria bacterium]|nr:CBS domain-containing protein [Alphaproteobacteria bacterium]